MVESGVESAIEEAVKAIKKSKVYQEYRKQLERVKQVPGLKDQIDEFRLKNFELQNSGDYALDKLEEFERQYESFRANPIVEDFLAAELSFCRMMQEMQEKMIEEVEFE